ncbi:MAG: hypothetical protein ACI9ON_002010 [Limisphaerales bacterium]
MAVQEIELKPKSLVKLRRLALQAQGLTRPQSFGRGLGAAEKAIQHLGYVQIDTISVVERAHHHVLRSRVPNYQPDMLERLLQAGSVFEYWAHAAAFLPISDYRFSLPYKDAIKSGKRHWYKNPDYKLMKQLMKRIDQEGALRSRDIEEDGKSPGGWWEWKPAKRALQQLYFQGDLMVSTRQGFQKTYDLPERVLPKGTNTHRPTATEHANHILDQQLDCHGFVSLKGITYQRRDSELRTATKTEVDRRLKSGELVWLRIPNCAVYLARPQLLDASSPRLPEKLHILSPFDNTVIQRERLTDLFNFDYQIECYVPEPKRQFGYFCLPLLYQDRFVGRMDCKVHRKDKHLEVRALHLDMKDEDHDALFSALVAAIGDFMSFQGANRVSLTKTTPQALHKSVNRHLNTQNH